MIARSVLLCTLAGLLLTGASTGGAAIPIDAGGGLLAGGYFGELRHDWNAGPGAILFVQLPWKSDFEARFSAAMLWNDGSRVARVPSDDPDLGALPGERPDSFRRASYAASILWRVEAMALGEVGVPYLGAGVARHERVVTFASTPPDDAGQEGDASGTRRSIGWDSGVHALAGLRLYRTSGLFLALETTLHAIDTSERWSFGYDGALLLGMQLHP